MSKLTAIIPAQGFELIRDRIAVILVDEIANQITLGIGAEFNAKVFVERIVPIDKSETPLINVLYSRTGYDNNDFDSSDGQNTYHIDIYAKANAKPSTNSEADNLAQVKLARLIGIVRAILESPHYLTKTIKQLRKFVTFLKSNPKIVDSFKNP